MSASLITCASCLACANRAPIAEVALDALSFGDAIVRNIYNGVSELEGKTNNTKIGVLMVWANEGSTWRLYARQAYRL